MSATAASGSTPAANAGAGLPEQAPPALIRLLRIIFPHPGFPEGPYRRTADQLLTRAAVDGRLAGLLLQGLTDLDTLREHPFAELSEAEAEVVVRGVAGTAFFEAVRSAGVVSLYDDHQVWELLGYEGPSFERGGYLHRGFDDLDWLPEPRIEEVEG